MCIVEFGKRFGMWPALSFNYLKTYLGLALGEKCCNVRKPAFA